MFKGKMFLHQVTESDQDSSIDDLRNGGIKFKYIDHDFQVDIIKHQAAHGGTKVPHQLVPSS
jgi:hypothetical protein